MSIAFFMWLKNWTASSTTTPDSQSVDYKFEIFAVLGGSTVMFAIVRSFYFAWITTQSSKHLHDKMLKAVLRTPVRFFDTNPYGRIQNRFSKDIGIIDDYLPRTLSMSMLQLFFSVGSLVLISISNPWLNLGGSFRLL